MDLKLSLREFGLLLNLIVAIALCLLNIVPPTACAVYALLISALVIWNSIKTDNKRITYSTAWMLYTIATQFGLVIPYLFFGRDTFPEYSDWTLGFMQSDYLSKAILLGVIAVISMNIGVLAARIKYLIKENASDYLKEDVVFGNRMYLASLILLSIVLLFFAYNILSGGMRIASTYETFRRSSAYNSSIYSYILIIFYVGTLYLASAGSIKSHKVGWALWGILVLIFALNGNKGEFMYALLAVIGMKGVEGQKINRKMVLLIALTLFLIIPGITSLRSIGILGNVHNARINLFDAFGEMGMQIRMTVYTLRDLANNRYGYLWGESYWRPIFNILTPVLIKHTQATATLRALYPGNGYSQVAESYLNFNIPGVILFYCIIGYLIGKFEAKINNRGKLAYLGTIVCILINATRNYYAFVPGQILIVTLIFLIANKLKAFKQGGKLS